MTKVKAGLSIVTLGVAVLLAGCESWPDSLNPDTWVEQGNPNANAKGPKRTYPKLSSVPERPAPRDEEAQKKSQAQLEADRQTGRAAAVAAPPTTEGLVADTQSARYTDQDLRREQIEPAAAPPPAAPEPPASARAPTPAPAPEPKPVQAEPVAPPKPVPPPQTAAAPPAPEPPAAPPPPQPMKQAAPTPATPPAPPPPEVIAMAPVRSPGDPPLVSAAAPTPAPSRSSSHLRWGPPPSDIELVQGARAPLRPARPGGAIASVLFTIGSSRLAPDDEVLLRQVAARFLQTGGTISIVGHASQTAEDHDSMRRQIANFSVSMDRATAVAQALQRYGVPSEAIAISAQIDPVALNDAGGRRADVFLR